MSGGDAEGVVMQTSVHLRSYMALTWDGMFGSICLRGERARGRGIQVPVAVD
jgi:hypothetical protein